uniref:Uncharacterized protein n=1 Tax=Romanomermis culicivorax TaxID=13658 RepID=A0A915HVC0_ROMCU
MEDRVLESHFRNQQHPEVARQVHNVDSGIVQMVVKWYKMPLWSFMPCLTTGVITSQTIDDKFILSTMLSQYGFNSKMPLWCNNEQLPEQ